MTTQTKTCIHWWYIKEGTDESRCKYCGATKKENLIFDAGISKELGMAKRRARKGGR